MSRNHRSSQHKKCPLMRVLGFGTALIRSILKTLFPTKGKSPGEDFTSFPRRPWERNFYFGTRHWGSIISISVGIRCISFNFDFTGKHSWQTITPRIKKVNKNNNNYNCILACTSYSACKYSYCMYSYIHAIAFPANSWKASRNH